MILADTSVWADHFRTSDARLTELLVEARLLMHPFVLGEIALGYLRGRASVLSNLQELPSMHVADPEEILHLVERHDLVGAGIGYVDVHLLASALTTTECQLWTRDKRLAGVAARLDVAARIDH